MLKELFEDIPVQYYRDVAIALLPQKHLEAPREPQSVPVAETITHNPTASQEELDALSGVDTGLANKLKRDAAGIGAKKKQVTVRIDPEKRLTPGQMPTEL